MEKNQYTKKCHQRGSFVKLSESDMCTTMQLQYAEEKIKNKLQRMISQGPLWKSFEKIYSIILKQKK